MVIYLGSVPQFTVCRMATSDDVGKSVVSSEGFVGHSLSALVPLQCSSLVASPSPPSLGVLVTKLSLRSRIWEGSYHTPYLQFPCLKGTHLNFHHGDVSSKTQCLQSLFPKDTKAPER